MNGPDGKPFKTREGGVLKLKDLILMVEEEAKKRLQEMAAERNYSQEELDTISRQVGIATLKYADLKNNRSADYIFDLKRFSEFEGNTGPYLLYAAVRIQSILKKAADLGYQPGEILPPIRATEKTLHLECLKLPEAISRAHQLWEPHHLADFGYGLSQAFSSFYKECHIMNESDAARRAAWLGLCKLVHAQLSRTLNLLGIEIPARM
jgi:arginyl-tRNA synthetase